MRLDVLGDTYAIARLPGDEFVPRWKKDDEFVSITRTRDELSVVIPQEALPPGVDADRDWRCLKLEGPLDLGLTGILVTILEPLADAGIAVFPIATYETDYVLIKSGSLDDAVQALRARGHEIFHLP